MKRLILTCLIAVVCVFANTTTALAQVTTSGINGKITSQDQVVVGATVTAIHKPSGTVYRAATNENGRFTIQGMRVGGPYQIVISYVGNKPKEINNVQLSLGETSTFNVNLQEDAQQLGEVVVSGRASKFSKEKTGATTNISNAQIMDIPTISRSISDIARISPYANGMSFAGGDGRSTNFRLDGANLNNNFGLSSKLPGGGNPISMDAIDEVQVVVAPYDVRQSNFIGGGINAVTKSGTNTFKGTAYIYYNNEKWYMHGNRVDKADLVERKTDRNTTYGFTLGGPIIKDKLFFFTNFEHSKIPSIINRWKGSTDGNSNPTNQISRTTLADLQKVSDFVKQKYGYDTGSYTNFPADENNSKFLARLDWNITNAHHLALRYNYTKDKSWNMPAANSSDAYTRTSYSQARASEYSMTFANSAYSMENKVSSVSADLNSRFGEKISNQLLFTYSNIQEVRGTNSSDFPFIDILNGEYSTDGTKQNTDWGPYMSLGYELFTYNNKVENKITTLTDNFTYFLGNHKITAGLSYEHQSALNSYMRNGTGYYRYRSMDDFLHGAAPETVALTYGYNGNNNPAASVTFNQYGLYLQDEWNVVDNLKLTGGIRFDNITFNNDDVVRNNAIYNLDFGGRHIDTGSWPSTNIQVSPRLGFTWDVLKNKSLIVRGGTGLFAGRLPLVFFTNMPSNSGMVQNLVIASTTYKKGVVTNVDKRLQQFDINHNGMVTDVNKIRDILGAPASITSDQGTVPSSIAGVDHNFKMPQVWKSSIAVDYQIPVSFPFTVTGEFTYTKKINDVMLDNYNIKPIDDTWSKLNGSDNRYVYPTNYTYYDSKFISNACVLTNTHKGYGWTANITLNAQPIKDLNIMAAYTHTVMKEITGMPGANASSAWSGLYTVNGPNFSGVQNSQYVIPDRLIASISYKYHNDLFSVFYTGYSPSGYSFLYTGDLNGDGIKSDLIYIPANENDIKFTNEADRKAFWDFVNQDSYLNNHKGQYAEAYSARAPFVHRFDFKWAHDFKLNVGDTKHTLQLSLDIMNVGNLFNSKWGVEKNMLSCANGQILKVDKVDNTGTPYFSMNTNPDGTTITHTWQFNHDYEQCWKLQIGVKYYFN